MNLIAIDIGNTNIVVALYLKGEEQSIDVIGGNNRDRLAEKLASLWEAIPVAKRSKEGKRDGVIVVSSVKPSWTAMTRKIVEEKLGEEIKLIGEEIPLPMDLWVDEPNKVGTDRVVSAAAAFAVAEEPVVVANFGTAVTIDFVDRHGIFQGGVICPGFEMSARALEHGTAQLPLARAARPSEPYGKNTSEAISAGLYFAAVGTLQEVVRRFAEKNGVWPRTIITGSAAELIKDDTGLAVTYVPNLVVKGVALAYRKYIQQGQ